MKTSFKAIAFALMISATPLFAAQKQKAENATTLKTGVYFSKDGKLNINVENKSSRAATLLIRDANQNIVFRRANVSKSYLSSVKLDLRQLPDGEYQIEVSNGKDRVANTVQLETPVSERIMIVGNNPRL